VCGVILIDGKADLARLRTRLAREEALDTRYDGAALLLDGNGFNRCKGGIIGGVRARRR